MPAVMNRLPRDPLTGDVLCAYVGRASDDALYRNSQSGGIVSALLSDALKSGEIAAAVTTVMVEGNPPRAVARLARQEDEIQQAQKSKYCPVPLLGVLGEVEKSDGPVALVGVSCQIHGLCNILASFPELKKKIRFTLGLVCDRIMTYGAIDYLVKKTDLSLENCKMLHFRDKTCGGYPGSVRVLCSDGRSVGLPASIRVNIKDWFTPARCRLCFDKMNVLADIVIGDPHGITEVDRVGGESIVVVRTEVGRRKFRSALSNGALTVREIDYQQVLTGQKIDKKRIEWRGYIDAWSKLGYPLPNFCKHVLPHSTQKRGRGDLTCPPCVGQVNYRHQLRHALMLDGYPSRSALVAAAERKLFVQKIKRRVTLPWRVMKYIFARITKTLAQGVGSCYAR